MELGGWVSKALGPLMLSILGEGGSVSHKAEGSLSGPGPHGALRTAGSTGVRKRAACLFILGAAVGGCLPAEGCLSAVFAYLAECREGQGERQVQTEQLELVLLL